MTITIKGGQKPERNQACPCGSGLKYKRCHGDPIKQEICNRIANEMMLKLIQEEIQKQYVEVTKNEKLL